MSREAGSATIWVVVAMMVVIAAATVMGLLGVTATARHQADAAADAAALRVAMAAIDGETVACRDGAGLAVDDGADLVSCALKGADAVVTVQVRLPGFLARFGSATGRARAGPASEGTAIAGAVPQRAR